MLILQGILRAATVLGGGTNKKTGEVIPERPVLQIETLDSRGLVEVPNHHRSQRGWMGGQGGQASEPPGSRLGTECQGWFYVRSTGGRFGPVGCVIGAALADTVALP